MSYYFCSFASSNMMPSLLRIRHQAGEFDLFKKIYTYTEKSLPWKKQKELKNIIHTTGLIRGYGYWSWKPYVILKTLEKLRDGDFLLYCDAGCHLNPNAKEKMLEYFQLASEHDIFVTQLPEEYCDRRWTKRDVLQYFEGQIPKEELLKGQYQGGIVFLKKNEYVLSIIRKWNVLMSLENIHFFDDSPSVLANDDSFVEHRHDQSIWSLLLKSNHCASLPVYLFEGSIEENSQDKPVLCCRDKEFVEPSTLFLFLVKVKGILRRIKNAIF